MSRDKLKNYLEAEVRVKRLLEDGLEMIETIDSLEQLAKESKVIADKAVEEKSVVIADLEKSKDDLKKAREKVLKVQSDAEERAKKIVTEAENHAQTIMAKAVLDADKRKREVLEEVKKAEAKLAGLEAFAEEWRVKADAAKTAHDTYMAALGK